MKAELGKMIQEARDSIIVEVAELNQQIREASAELRREKSKERLEQARKAVVAIQEQMKSKALQPKEEEDTAEQAPDSSHIAVGDIVGIKEVNLKATVLSLFEDKHEVEVQAGQTRLRLGLDKIDKITSPGSLKLNVETPARVKILPRSVPRELDLRGKRAEEVQPALDRYLNDASIASQREVRIIHGFGTGVVRQIVRELLATHPLVKSFRAGNKDEGGDGVTIVQP
jgi:DNA mismatch repair protein MutS2